MHTGANGQQLRLCSSLEQMPKEISEIRGHRPRLQLVAGIVDAGFCDSFRKFLMRTALTLRPVAFDPYPFDDLLGFVLHEATAVTSLGVPSKEV